MKKIVILSLIILPLALSGCSKGQSQDNLAENKVNREDFAMHRPDFGQPEREADVRGLVNSVTGNEVDVLKIERPQMGQGQNKTEDGETSKDGEERKTTLGTGTSGGHIPGMGGGMRGQRPDMDEDMEAQMLERMKELATGEETIIIPVGIQMLKPDSASEKPGMVEASLEDVKKDTMIQVWLNEDVADRSVAEFVLIMN